MLMLTAYHDDNRDEHMLLFVAKTIWGFPKIRGTFLGVPIIRTIVFWGLYWGPLILRNYHICNHGWRGWLERAQSGAEANKKIT